MFTVAAGMGWPQVSAGSTIGVRGRGGGREGGMRGGGRQGVGQRRRKARIRSHHENLNRNLDQALPATREDGELNFGPVSFVCSFVIIANWTLLQVMLAFFEFTIHFTFIAQCD